MVEGKITGDNISVEQNIVTSSLLKRDVIVDAYLPVNVEYPKQMELLLINDGQDLPQMPFDVILNNLITNDIIVPLICVGIYCGPDRKMEYGTAAQTDFKGRGAKAKLYTQFVFKELLPFIRKTYHVSSPVEKSFAGFSLGALSALDIVLNHPREFSKAGLFSGSFWWRSKSYKDGYDDTKDRILHRQIRTAEYAPWLKFFFECGAFDETKDRNNNGIIDSIDDTLDLIKELRFKGYSDNAIQYLELADGKHDVQEEIVFDEYYRCYCVGGKYVRIMPYEPRNPHHLRYAADFTPSPERLKQMEEIVLRINKFLGYDFNTVELALRDGEPYAIDFCNPAPDADRNSVGEQNFAWVVETAANYAIEKALAQQDGLDNLTWGEYVKRASNKEPLYS